MIDALTLYPVSLLAMCNNSYTTPVALGDPITFCLPRESFISAAFQHLCVVYRSAAWRSP